MKFNGNRLNQHSLSRELEIVLARLTLKENTRITDWLETKESWRPKLLASSGMTIANPKLDYAEYSELGGDLVYVSVGFSFDVTVNGYRVDITPLPFAPVPRRTTYRPLSADFYFGGMLGGVAYISSENGGSISCKRADGALFGLGTGTQVAVSGIYRRTLL